MQKVPGGGRPHVAKGATWLVSLVRMAREVSSQHRRGGISIFNLRSCLSVKTAKLGEVGPTGASNAQRGRPMMMSFICSCRNKKEEPSSIYTLRKVRTIRGCLEGLALMI